MPRYARQTAEGSVQHVISRFVNRQYMLDLTGGRTEYLRRAAAACAGTDWRPLAFALMSSHVHWALVAGEKPSHSFIKPLHSGFAGWVNRTQSRIGPVFADRHRTIRCVGETAAAVIAYIHNNPVRARVVEDPLESDWTSHRMFVGLEPAPPWMDIARGLELCGFSRTKAGRQAFHEFVLERRDEARCSVLSGNGLRERRRRVRSDWTGQVEVATPVAEIHFAQRQLHLPVIVPQEYPARMRSDIALIDVLRAVSQLLNIDVDVVRSRDRSRSVVLARRLVLLVWVREFGQPIIQMARALDLAASSAGGLISSASDGLRERAKEFAELIVSRRRGHGGADSL